MEQNKYLNPALSGSYAQAVINGVQESYEQSDDLIDYIGTINITAPNVSDSESLLNGNFASGSHWTLSGATISGGHVSMMSIGSPPTVTQAMSDMVNVHGYKTYKLAYTVVSTAANTKAWIAAGFASVITYLDIKTTGTKFLYFFTAGTPTDFVLSCTASGGTVQITGLSLKEISYDIKDVDLNSIGLMIGYPRPVMPSPFVSADGYLDSHTYIVLLKMFAQIKYNGMSFYTLDELVYYILTELGGSLDYIYKWSSDGRSSPTTDLIINLLDNVDDVYIYLLQTILKVFLGQGVVVNFVRNPFCFAKWVTGAWAANPEGSGMSRLNGGGTAEDQAYGGKMYAVL